MSRCVILSAGPVEDSERLRPLLKTDDWFIAADGGGRLAAALGVKPAVLVADFDSSAPPDTGGDTEIVRLPTEKDWTDTQAAAMLALDRGYRDFLLLGCTGGRLDHTLANIAVLLYLLRRGADALMADERNFLRLYGPGRYRVERRAGYKLSLFPYGGEVEGITVKNVRYPLEKARLTPDNSLGVSNEFLENPAEISFDKGVLMVFLSKD